MATNYMVIKNGLVVQGPITASFANTTASWAVSASWAPPTTNATNAQTASYISSSAIFDTLPQNVYQLTSSWAVNAQNITSSGVSGTVTQALNAGFASQAVQATSSLSASYVQGGNVAGAVANATNAVFAQQAVQATSSLSASYVTASNVVGIVANATSASYAGTSSVVNGLPFSNVTTSIAATLTASLVITVATSSYIAGFFDYAAVSQSNIRAGTVFGSWLTNGSVTYTEVTNVDVGNTQDVTMSLGLGTGGTVQLSASSVIFAGWQIRALGRFL